MEGYMQTIAVMGSGMVKSMITLNLAVLLAKQFRTTIVDGNFVLNRIANLLGLDPETNITHYFSGDKSLRDILIRSFFGLGVVPASGGDVDLLYLEPDLVQSFFESLDELGSRTEFQLIDCPDGYTKLNNKIIQFANQILVVTPASQIALDEAFITTKILVGEQPNADINVVIYDTGNSNPQTLFDDLNLKVYNFSKRRINLAGTIRSDACLNTAGSKNPLVVEFPNSTAAIDLQAIAFNLWRISNPANQEIITKELLNDWVN
jgi:flagellar biosynthesis protein FlhG